jgi:hypothetical protein
VTGRARLYRIRFFRAGRAQAADEASRTRRVPGRTPTYWEMPIDRRSDRLVASLSCLRRRISRSHRIDTLSGWHRLSRALFPMTSKRGRSLRRMLDQRHQAREVADFIPDQPPTRSGIRALDEALHPNPPAIRRKHARAFSHWRARQERAVDQSKVSVLSQARQRKHTRYYPIDNLRSFVYYCSLSSSTNTSHRRMT